MVALAQTELSADIGYAGEISPQDAYRLLQENDAAILVDVRTQPEWNFVGMPDIAATKGRLAAISWKVYPSFALNTEFAAQLAAAGAKPESPLLFLCRSGGRSLDAAMAMTQAGYKYCYNITGGFEGEPDATRHRGVQDGWKANNLPWAQS